MDVLDGSRMSDRGVFLDAGIQSKEHKRGCLFVADCNSCLYYDAQEYISPTGEYVITVRSSSMLYMIDARNIKLTAANNGFVFDSDAESRVCRAVSSWSIEWLDDDTAVFSADDGTRYEQTVTVEFSPGCKPDFIGG